MSILSVPTNYANVNHRRLSRGVPPVVIVPPASEPVTLEEAKRHARVSGNDENPLLEDYITAAREAVEFDAQVALITQTCRQSLDCFPTGAIELRKPPVQSVSSVTYVDFGGTTCTADPTLLQFDLTSRPGLILPGYLLIWPIARVALKSVNVTFVTGYGAASAVPLCAKQAMYLKIAASYWNREMYAEERETYEALLDTIRWRKL